VRTFQQMQETGARDYHVHGAIEFEMVHREKESVAELEFLRTAILDADRQFPWVDAEFTGPGLESIRTFEPPAELVVEGTRTVWVKINARVEFMRRSQVYAYERYLAKIAETIAADPQWKGIVKKVESVIYSAKKSTFLI
jgi:hypothetical protein